MVRIIGGRARGTRLEVPSGDTVRPTSDRVREALFNVLSHRFELDFDDLKVLDLFAGSGTLGLEALSRGANEVCFVERNTRVSKVLSRNVERLPGNGRVLVRKVEDFLDDTGGPFDLVFMDPPYAAGVLPDILARLTSGTWLGEAALVCVEHPASTPMEAPEGLTLEFHRVYGGTAVGILSRS